MSRRRGGCLLFGLVWAVVFGATNYVFALGDPPTIDRTGIANCDPHPTRWTDYLLYIEIAILVVAGWVFYRLEMKDGEL